MYRIKQNKNTKDSKISAVKIQGNDRIKNKKYIIITDKEEKKNTDYQASPKSTLRIFLQIKMLLAL